MTHEHDPEATVNSGGDAGREADVSDITPLDPDTEALVTSTLASLPKLAMPEDVHQRLLAAIAAEPNPYAIPDAGSPTADASTVTALPARRARKNRWFVGVAGVAAASVLGLVVGASILDSDTGSTTPITAAAIPMTASSKQYQKENFSTQVAAALPEWRSSAAHSAGTDTAKPNPLATQSQNVQPSATPSSSQSGAISGFSIDMRVREQVAACLSKISSRAPMHVEIASYRSDPTTPTEQIAVAAVDGDNKSVEVYAVSVACNAGDPQLVREHVTLDSQ